jgi:hypothetical protein
MKNPVKVLPIDCQENIDGSLRCKWIDDEGHEHVLCYKKDKEYLYFDILNRNWTVLLTDISVPSISTASSPLFDDKSNKALGESPRGLLNARLDNVNWEPYQLYVVNEEPGKKKGEWLDSERIKHYLEWDPSIEFEYYDEARKIWYALPKLK